MMVRVFVTNMRSHKHWDAGKQEADGKERGAVCLLVLLLRKHKTVVKLGNAPPASSLARKNTTFGEQGHKKLPAKIFLRLLALEVPIAVVSLAAHSWSECA